MVKNINPHKAVKDENVIKSLESIVRLDKDGYLYFMENSINYLCKDIIKTVSIFEQKTKKWVATTFNDACSAFCTKDFNGSMLTGRAYDFGHWRDDGSSYGLNLMIHTNKNAKYGIKYETICTTDVALSLAMYMGGKKLLNGALDDGHTDLSALTISPLFVTDGINEKGLTASILLLPLDNLIQNHKDYKNKFIINESHCTNTMSIPRTVRWILDNCETVLEVEEMLKKIWCLRFTGNSSHIFVTDRFGNSRLFEWYMKEENSKVQELACINTNAATNFYQAFSNIPNDMPYLTNLKNHYNYGWSKQGIYRNTYDRFNTIVSMLDFYTLDKPKEGEIVQAVMKEQTADAILRTLALYPAPSSTNHQTQYSCLFNSKELTNKIYSFANLNESWTYSLKKHNFIKK